MKVVNLHHFEAQNKCIFTLLEGTPTYDEAVNSNHITVNVVTKEVGGIHSFFQKILIEAAIENSFENIVLQTDNVKSKDFFKTEEFNKLLIFINEQIIVCNSTLDDLSQDIKKGDNKL